MRIVTILSAIVIGGLILGAAWLYSADDQWEVQHQITIDAPASEIYPLLASLKALPSWSAWNTDFIPTLQSRYSGADSGVGASEYWSYDGSSGSTVITEAEPNKRVAYKVIDSSGYFVANGYYELKETANGTQINWVYGGDTQGNLIMKLIMLSVKPQIDEGNRWSLENLQQIMQTQS